jgi:hypothetical protein
LTQLKLLQNSKIHCDKTHKLNVWQNLNYDTTQNSSNGDSSDSSNSDSSVCTNSDSSYSDSSMSDLGDNSSSDSSSSDTFLVKTTWHLKNRWDFSGQLFAILQCFLMASFTSELTLG